MLQHIFSATELIGRLLLVTLFALESWIKLNNIDATVSYMEKFGVPAGLLVPAILVEGLGSMLIAIGWHTRIAALALAGFCLLTAAIFHTGFSNVNELLHFWKDVAIAGGFLVLFARGAEAWSVDAWDARAAIKS
jgi:putative oxidoreductase